MSSLPSMSKSSAIIGLVVVGAFVVGRFLAPEPPTPTPSAPAAIVRDRGPATTTVVREIVREREVETDKPTPVVELAPEVIEQRHVALGQARGIVSAAVHARRWTSADARSLLAVMHHLGPDDIDEVMTSLILPVNAGQLNVETGAGLLDPS